MLVDLPRRWRWALASGSALVLMLLIALLAAGRRDDASTTLRPESRGPRASRAPVPLGGAAAATAPVRAPPQPPATPVLARDLDEVQVCGGAWVKRLPDGAPDSADIERATGLPEVRAQVIAALRADSRELAQATALWMDILGDSTPQRLIALAPSNGCTDPACRAEPAMARQVEQARDALVRLAVSSTDPQVYALAFHACGKGGTGACQLLSAAQWARLDPDNAAPWLAVLSAAKAGNDRAAQAEALHRIATARRSEQGFFTVPGLIAAAVPLDESSLLAASTMVFGVIGMQAVQNLPAYQEITSACKGAALRDANQRQTCAAIADVLADRSDTLIERAIGAGIGRQVGWPAERGERMRGEYASYLASTWPAQVDAFADTSCGVLQRSLDLIRRQALSGETGVLREWVAQSGKRPEDFAREERQREAQRLQAASAATP